MYGFQSTPFGKEASIVCSNGNSYTWRNQYSISARDSLQLGSEPETSGTAECDSFFLANSWNYSASYLGVRCGGDLVHRVQPNQGRCLQRTYEALTADTFTFSHTGKIWFPCLIMGAKLVIVHYIFESNNYTHCLVSPITFSQPPCLEMHVRIRTGESFT